MDMASKLARRYGMGIELECDEGMLYSRYDYDLFYKQLDKAHQLGLDGDTTNAYYAGTIKGTLVTAARSNVPQIRGIYDDIYRWISGTYN